MFVDLPERELRSFTGAVTDPHDFDEFWADTLAASRSYDIAVSAERVASPLRTVDVYDVTYSGYAGQRIRAWLRVPAGCGQRRLPAVVQYHGYGRGRGDAVENLLWASAGYAHLEMDTRGQGWSGSRGVTPDTDTSGRQVPGFVTRGVGDRDTYYFRRLIVDAVRAVDAARSIPQIDPDRVAVFGVSQGGGLSLAVAGLTQGLRGVVARVPFLCDIARATTITDASPYSELREHVASYRCEWESVRRTVSYFDGVNFARRASAPLQASVALMDAVCPPSTVFAAFNAYTAQKDIAVWTHNGHEGGGVDDDLMTLQAMERFLRD
ncbi:cephalosporin-C deacetylase [Humibacter antri]